jgi:hypothetical protein
MLRHHRCACSPNLRCIGRVAGVGRHVRGEQVRKQIKPRDSRLQLANCLFDVGVELGDVVLVARHCHAACQHFSSILEIGGTSDTIILWHLTPLRLYIL